MRKVRVYVDTSVFGGAHDEEFKDASLAFFDQVVRGRYLLLVSELTLDELSLAPRAVQDFVANLPSSCVVQVASEVEDEAEELAEAYLQAGVLGKASRSDALHVAVATVARADVILSWNFKHIVNYERIHEFNGVNTLKGYAPISIHSPLEMNHADQDQDL
jgi:predicted nucleic acid-binding protein